MDAGSDLTPRKVARYGWRPDLPDQRDLHFTITAPVVAPPHVDLRGQCPPVYDQGQLGSCTANALGGAYEFAAMKEGGHPVTPSRLFIYYGERVIEGTVRTDAGAMLRDGAKVLATVGVPPETVWPYDIAKFARKPPRRAFSVAAGGKVSQYQRVAQRIGDLRACLAAGFPFAGGFTVYESFESPSVAASGIVEMPGPAEKIVGGHAVLVVGYDDATGRFLVRNSWGDTWGQAGYFTMPYAYLTNPHLASDFWTIRLVD